MFRKLLNIYFENPTLRESHRWNATSGEAAFPYNS